MIDFDRLFARIELSLSSLAARSGLGRNTLQSWRTSADASANARRPSPESLRTLARELERHAGVLRAEARALARAADKLERERAQGPPTL